MICLFLEGEPSLLLSKVRRDAEGKLKFGWVENGCWDFEIHKDEVLAKDGNYIVNRWPAPEYYEIDIPEKVKGDYNTVMCWAREEYERINK
jgi:hypothetical protein